MGRIIWSATPREDGAFASLLDSPSAMEWQRRASRMLGYAAFAAALVALGWAVVHLT